MSPFLAELLGTMLRIILGDGVVANVVLNKTKGQNSGRTGRGVTSCDSPGLTLYPQP